jgi:hypothetical protein
VEQLPVDRVAAGEGLSFRGTAAIVPLTSHALAAVLKDRAVTLDIAGKREVAELLAPFWSK